MLNPHFISALNEILSKEEISEFIESLNLPVVRNVRYNPFKDSPKEIAGDKIEWAKDGVALSCDKVFTTDPLFHAGGYYVQEASSMYIEEIFEKVIFPKMGRELKVLDLCAAPGGKSTHINSLLDKNSVLVANETIRSRANILKENIIKWGSGNVIVTNSDPEKFSNLSHYFDVIIIDAPCSGEGMFRKSEKAQQQWSKSNVELCVQRQQRIVSDAWNALKQGGIMIYSTCTFNLQENERNIAWFIENLHANPIHCDLNLYNKIVCSDTLGAKGYRFYPHKVQSEGFFVSILQKGEEIGKNREIKYKQSKKFPPSAKDNVKILSRFIEDSSAKFIDFNNCSYYCNERVNNTLHEISDCVDVIYFGVEIGEIIHNKLKPSHSLALYHNLKNDSFKRVDVELDVALEFLRKNSIDSTPFQEGYNIVTYKNIPIGFVKKVSNRVNNLYPKESRILNL